MVLAPQKRSLKTRDEACSCYLPDRRGESHPGGLEHLATDPETFTPDGESLAGVFEDDLLKRFEVLLDIGPCKAVSGLLQPVIEFFPQHESQKAAENVAANTGICLVENWSGCEQRFRRFETVFDRHQIAIAQDDLQR